MRTRRPNAGAALIYVLILVALATMQMALFMRATRALQRDTDLTLSFANKRDLHASAAAWVRVNGTAQRPATTLDTAELGIRDSALTVSVGPDGAAAIDMAYRCPALRRVVRIHPDGSRTAGPVD